MKINISFCENVGELRNIEIDDIDEYESVRFVKVSLDQKCATNGEKFYLIYKNIILDEDRIIKFYKVRENDKIWIGKLENFLQSDHVILELFLSGSIPSLIYWIVKKNSIFEIKSIIPNVVNVWDIRGCEIEIDDIVTDIDRDGVYHKLIINCDNTSIGENIHTYGDCCDIYDKYLIRNYLKKYPLICWPIFKKENWEDELKEPIKEFRRIIEEEINPILDDKISMMPKSFVNSRFLFSMDMADRIIIICDDYWNMAFHVSKYAFRDYFLASLHVAMADYSDSSQSSDVDKSIKDIVLDALDYFMNYLNDDKDDWRYLMKLFLDKFLFGQYDESQIKEIFESNENCNPSAFVRINQKSHLIEIPVQSQRINQIKRAISMQIDEPIENLYFVKCGVCEEPTDEEIIERHELPKCIIEIVSSFLKSSFEVKQKIGKGSFSKVLLCKDKLTKKEFLMKMPNENESLYNEISIQCHIGNSKLIKKYIGLIFYEDCICMIMEYMSNRSLISYLEEKGCLHEAIIAKLSHQILSQIKDIHEAQIIHRDIKGDNIVLDKQDEAKLIDFGLAICKDYFTDEEFTKHLIHHSLGTWGYIALELFNVDKIDFTNKIKLIDIWSFGVVVIEMINGERIKGQLGINLKELKIKAQKPISDDLIMFYKSCVNHPDKRWSADELLKSKFIRKHKKNKH